MNGIASWRNREAVKRPELLVGYLLGGYPDRDSFLEFASGSEDAGLDVLEVGFPAQNPCTDGEVIRRAHAIADHSICTDLAYWKALRDRVKCPIWLMGYEEDFNRTGMIPLLAKEALVDAIVIPDMDAKERLSLEQQLSPMGTDVLGFVNPQMSIAEQVNCFEHFCLIYQQLYAGQTGMPVEPHDFAPVLARARNYPHVKAFAGFGISTPERVNELLTAGFDGAIVGTALVRKLNESPDALYSLIRDLKTATVKAGEQNAVHCNL